MASRIKDRLAELALTLPPPPTPRGDYAALVVHNGIAYISGQLSRTDQGTICGPVSHSTSPDRIRDAAQACVLRALSSLATVADSLDSVERILFLRGFVNAASGFEAHSAVLDEASRLLLAVFGEQGQHARSAVGVTSLPSGGLLEIELTVALAFDRRLRT